MKKQVDPQIAGVLHLLPLKDPANLTPQRARVELIELAKAGMSAPLPMPATVVEATIVGATGPSLQGCTSPPDFHVQL